MTFFFSSNFIASAYKIGLEMSKFLDQTLIITRTTFDQFVQTWEFLLFLLFSEFYYLPFIHNLFFIFIVPYTWIFLRLNLVISFFVHSFSFFFNLTNLTLSEKVNTVCGILVSKNCKKIIEITTKQTYSTFTIE